ncbi:MAG: glycoside hydrolase family 99-like domain-containing protein [Gammaproteobacteria bacterium]|nr:glycoside hydrolase family 99-like domain-containing protein [Gammaproteobacteria bacterium]
MSSRLQSKAVLIAGMHRSGTSALSRTLNLAGCDLPKVLMESDSRSNERGHWESQRIFELNNEILASAGSYWDQWETLNPGWYTSPLHDRYFQEARRLLQEEFPSSPLFVVKDPRFCLLMEFWTKALESVGATPLVVMTVRNPRDVAASLKRRDDIDPSIGMLLWLRHVLDAEAGSRNCRRVAVGFDQLLDDWRSVLTRIGERLEVSWPKLSSAADLEIDEFLTPDLRHHADRRFEIESATRDVRWITETHEILTRWSVDDERSSDLEALDRIRARLDELGPVFGRPLLVGRTARQNERILGGKVNELTTNLQTERGRVRDLEGTLSELSGHLETLDRTIVRQSEAAERRDAEIQALNQDIARRIAEIERRDTEIDALNQVITRQTGEAEERDAEIDSLTETLNEANTERELQVDSLMRAVNERDSRIAALMQSSSWRLTAPLREARLALGWLFRKSMRLAQIAGWLLTGRFRKAAQAMLPFYRRHAPIWIGSLIPRRVRHWLRATSTPPPRHRTAPDSDTADATARAHFVPEFRGEPAAEGPVRLIAFYLPQFHPIPENDRWWGEGFTEWTNVRAATPQFDGHYQPRVPIDMGHYDLRDSKVQHRQVEIARRYGIGGFCFYFYWFGGHRLLETPILNYLNDSTIDFPFCLCWANENWTRRWDGREQDLLIGQEHAPEDDLEFIRYVSRFLEDPRYIHVDGRPLLLVYRPALLPDAAETVERWQGWCRENGISEPFVAMVQSFQSLDPRPFGMEAAVEFPWHTGMPTDVTAHIVPGKSEFRGFVFDWDEYAEKCEEQPDQPWLQMRGVMPGWDNTPRRGTEAHLFEGHSPSSYGRWLRSAMRWTLAQERTPDERLLFINAWNEWGEGAYLEPDQRFGYAFLQATRDAVEEVAEHPVNPVHAHPLYAAGADRGEAALISKQVAPVENRHPVAPAAIRLKSPEYPDSPDISIVIPVYGNCQTTLHCLKSLAAITDGRSIEIIVVDDCSQDESGAVLSELPGIRYIRNDENLGFLQSCNRGADQARGRHLLLLNNDTLVQDGAIDALADTFEMHGDVGLVGAKLYFDDGSLQEAGGIVFSDGSASNYGRGDDPRKPEYNYVRDADYCSGAAIMLPLALWRELGGFDSYYVRAYYEDTDLAMRVREAGYRVLYQPFAKLVHSEGATSGTDLSQGEKRYQAENRVRFLGRWRKTLEARHLAPSTRPDIARDRAAAGRALVIDWATPMPDHDSGSVDILNLVRMLARLGIKSTFAAHRDLDYWGAYTDDLQKLGTEVLYAPYVDSLRSYLKQSGKDIDFVLVHRVGVFKELASTLRTLCPNARIVFHTVDLHHIREARQAETEQSEKLKKQARITKRTEIRLARKADAIVVVSDHEKNLLQEAVPDTDVFHLPLIRDIPGAGETEFSQRQGMAFLGNYLHPPNLDAVLYFVREIWPDFHAAVPGAELILGGAQMPAEVENLGETEGVRTIGYVEDLAGLFNRIRLTVAPLRYGAGAKGKVVSSLCHGVPVVASPVAAEGMSLENGRDILIAEDQAGWVKHLQAAYCDEALWRVLSTGGLDAMRKRHTLEAGAEELKRILCLNGDAPMAARIVQ